MNDDHQLVAFFLPFGSAGHQPKNQTKSWHFWEKPNGDVKKKEIILNGNCLTVFLFQKKATSVRLATYKTESDGAREIMLAVWQMDKNDNLLQKQTKKNFTVFPSPNVHLILRLLVECRYMPSSVQSVSYMVKTPSLGPAVQTQGVFGVQLRIAKGRFSSRQD